MYNNKYISKRIMGIGYMLILLFLLGCITTKSYSQQLAAIEYVKPLFDFDERLPLFQFTSEQKTNSRRYLRYTAYSNFREGVTPTLGEFGSTFVGINDSITGTRRLYMYNVSIQEMLTHYVDMDNNVYLEVENPRKYRYLPQYGSKDLWMRENAHCFELMMPLGSIKSIDILNDALSERLNIAFGKVKKRVPCLILTRTSSNDLYSSQGGFDSGYDTTGLLRNVPLKVFGSLLPITGKYFINETGYSGNVNLDLQISNWSDIKGINHELKRYDLMFKEEYRELTLYVIKEITNKK